MFEGLRTATYKADDLKRARDWYTEVLGYGPYFDEPFYVGFDAGGYELGLQPSGERPETGGVTVYWAVEDLDGALERLISLGASEHEAAQDVGEGIRLASVLDPFGNVLGVIYNPLFGVSD